MLIAHVVASLDARYGGPSRSVRRLAAAQAEAGHTVDILCGGAEEAVEEHGQLTVRTFRLSPPAKVCRSPDLNQHLSHPAYEVIHAHGIWLRPLHYAHIWAKRHRIPFVLSPRGMMASWAWQHHRRRKALAGALLHPGALKAVDGWHVTSSAEGSDIRRLGFVHPQSIAPNGGDVATPAQIETSRNHWIEHLRLPSGTRVALFYSRFHRKKRVIELIDLWNQLAPPGWLLLMVGLPDEFSVAQLRDYVSRAGGVHRVLVEDGTKTPAPFAIADLFLLPTHSENFGLVVAESLAHGVPCLVTDGAPWEEINAKQAGWCGSWLRFPRALTDALATPAGELRRRGSNGPAWMAADFSWARSARELVQFYDGLHRR